MLRAWLSALSERINCTVASCRQRSPSTTTAILLEPRSRQENSQEEERPAALTALPPSPKEPVVATVPPPSPSKPAPVLDSTTVSEPSGRGSNATTCGPPSSQTECTSTPLASTVLTTVPSTAAAEESGRQLEPTATSSEDPRESAGSNASTPGRSRKSSLNSSRAFHEEDQKYGERIADDALVTFCDRLKAALEKSGNEPKFEGWLGINAILIFAITMNARKELERAKKSKDADKVKALESELRDSAETQKEIEKAVTGRHRTVQILYDGTREHYVVVYRSTKSGLLTLYDSLQAEDPKASLNTAISDQILAIFGHLYPDADIPIYIPETYEQQEDHWSCGYRAIACVLALVLNHTPCLKAYDLGAIHTLLIDCLEHAELPMDRFAAARLWERYEDFDDNEDDKLYYVYRDAGERKKERKHKKSVDENNNNNPHSNGG